MKSIVVVCLSLVLAGAGHAAAQTEKPESLEDRVSYGIGFNLGSNLSAQGLELNLDLVEQGLRDAIGKSEPLLSNEEIQAAMTTIQTRLQAEMQAKMAAVAAENLESGKAFLADNAAKEGVVSLDSGLQYKVLSQGDGEKPTTSDTVRVHYEGTLIDGTVFDSSRQRGEPVEFPLNGVIKGWIEGLQLMTVGSRWQLVVPPALGYGTAGAGPQIGPNAVLIFDVELLDIVEPKAG